MNAYQWYRLMKELEKATPLSSENNQPATDITEKEKEETNPLDEGEKDNKKPIVAPAETNFSYTSPLRSAKSLREIPATTPFHPNFRNGGTPVASKTASFAASTSSTSASLIYASNITAPHPFLADQIQSSALFLQMLKNYEHTITGGGAKCKTIQDVNAVPLHCGYKSDKPRVAAKHRITSPYGLYPGVSSTKIQPSIFDGLTIPTTTLSAAIFEGIKLPTIPTISPLENLAPVVINQTPGVIVPFPRRSI